MTSTSSFKSIENHNNNIETYCDKDVVKILVGNKSDLEGERRVTFDDLTEKANELKMKYFETSAVQSKHHTILELFTEVAITCC